MKKQILFLCAAFLLLPLFWACDKEDDNIERLTIASERIYAIGAGESSDIPYLHLLYMYSGKWQRLIQPIKGFEYTPGFEYVLEVELVDNNSPSLMDYVGYYKLRKIISQVEKQSENLPEDSVFE